MPFYCMPDQQQLFVREFGQGKPVLVLSGLGMHSWQWLPFLYQHRHQHRFIIPDWRGFGASNNCKIPCLDAISSHWQDLKHLIQHLQLDRFAVIAHSMGATTAMHGMKYDHLQTHLDAYLQIDQTPRIAVDKNWQYGLFGPQHTEFKQRLHPISSLLAMYPSARSLSDLDLASRQSLLKHWIGFVQFQSRNPMLPFLLNTISKPAKLQRFVLPIQRIDYLAWYIDSYLYHDQDYREALTQLSCPSTFFIGEKSSLYASPGQKMIAQSVKNSTQIIFENSGHTPFMSEPIKFSRQLRSFLKNIV